MTMRSPQRKRGAGAAWRLASALLISVHGAGFSREHRRALQASYTYANAADATPYCSLLDASICSGNPQRFLQVTANGPFEGIIVGSYSTWLSFAAPALVDLDNDGEPDLLVGNNFGQISYFESVNSCRKSLEDGACSRNGSSSFTTRWRTFELPRRAARYLSSFRTSG